VPHLPELPSGPRLPNLSIGERLAILPDVYLYSLWKYPGPWLLGYLVVLSIAIGAAWRPVHVNTDISAFRSVAGNASTEYAVYRDSLRYTRAVKDEEQLGDRKTFQVEIIYEAKQQNGVRDSSVFSEAVLRDIRGFEHRLRSLAGWKRLCESGDSRAKFRCDPGESLGNYVWPRRLDNYIGPEGFFRLNFDGTAQERLPMHATLTLLAEGGASPHDPWHFLPQHYTGPASSAVLLRSLFAFTAPSLDHAGFSDQYSAFVKDELYPMLLAENSLSEAPLDEDSWDDPSNVKIYFKGTELEDFEVVEALKHDMRLAIGALTVAILISWVHLQSLFLSVVMFLVLIMSVLLAYVMVHIEKLSLASFLVTFIVIGLGGDSFLKLHDVWKRTKRDRPYIAPVDHLDYYYRIVALQLLPVSMTALIFFIHLISLMRPLREFGLFIATCMLCRCVLSLIIFIPAMLFHEQTLLPRIEQHAPPWLRKVLEPPEPYLSWRKVADISMRAANQGKRVLLVGAAVAVVALIASSAVAATREGGGLPGVFAESHHRSTGRALTDEFAEPRLTQVAAPLTATMCEPWNSVGCVLHWCDTFEETTNNTGECECHRKITAPEFKNCTKIQVNAQVSGDLEGRSTADWATSLDELIRRRWPDTVETISRQSGSMRAKPSIVFEHWESGATFVENLTQLVAAEVTLSASTKTDSACNVMVFCTCGHHQCKHLADYEALDVKLPVPPERRRLSGDDRDVSNSDSVALVEPARRRMSDLGVAADSMGLDPIEVVVMFGIIPPKGGYVFDGTPPWAFDTTFEPNSPWSQRAMLKICTDAEAIENLQVYETNCWISDFRKWLLDQGEIFPVQRFGSFQDDLKRFVADNPMVNSWIWLNEEGNMRATSMFVKARPGEDAQATVKLREDWLAYVGLKNSEAATTASQAWVTSKAWVEAEAFAEALSSTWVVTGFSLLAILVAGLLYTLDVEIMIITICIAIAACCYLCFFMFCIFQWSLGPWELIMMTVFLTYTVEPVFRIGRDFVLPPPTVSFATDDNSSRPLGDGAAAAIEGHAEAAGQAHPDGGTDTADVDGADNAVSGHPASTTMELAVRRNDMPEVGRKDPETDSSALGDGGVDCPEMALRRSVKQQTGAVMTNSLKLFVSGIFLLPCDFQLFSRLGAVGIIVSLILAPCTLIPLPAVLLVLRRTRREPDLKVVAELLHDKCAWLWT